MSIGNWAFKGSHPVGVLYEEIKWQLGLYNEKCVVRNEIMP